MRTKMMVALCFIMLAVGSAVPANACSGVCFGNVCGSYDDGRWTGMSCQMQGSICLETTCYKSSSAETVAADGGTSDGTCASAILSPSLSFASPPISCTEPGAVLNAVKTTAR
jgi:hypothetical protein